MLFFNNIKFQTVFIITKLKKLLSDQGASFSGRLGLKTLKFTKNLRPLDGGRFGFSLGSVNRCFQSAAWFLAMTMVMVFSWPQVSVAKSFGAPVEEHSCCCEMPDHVHKSAACECSTSTVSAFHPILAIQSTASLSQPPSQDFRWIQENQKGVALFEKPPTPPPRARV